MAGDKGELSCPICTEEMDLTDQQLKPCKCGYEVQACLFTHEYGFIVMKVFYFSCLCFLIYCLTPWFDACSNKCALSLFLISFCANEK